jgi:hypothetical protein
VTAAHGRHLASYRALFTLHDALDYASLAAIPRMHSTRAIVVRATRCSAQFLRKLRHRAYPNAKKYRKAVSFCVVKNGVRRYLVVTASS